MLGGRDRNPGLLQQLDEPGGGTEVADHGDLLRGLLGTGGVRGLSLGVRAVREPAVPRLAAQAARLDQPALREGRGELGAAEEGLPHGAGDGLVDVLPDQVGQLERAHLEAAALAQHGVDGGRVGALLLVHREGLGVEGAGDPVDDEARGVGAADRRLPPAQHGAVRALGGGRVGRETADHLDEREQRGRVEEVQAEEAAGVREAGGELGDGEGGGVRGQQGVRRDHLFECSEERALDGGVLDDGLDDERGAGEVGEGGGRIDPADRVLGLGRVETALRGHAVDAVLDDAHAACGELGVDVVDQHPVTCEKGDLGDALPHGAGADDRHSAGPLDCCHVLILPHRVIHRPAGPSCPDRSFGYSNSSLLFFTRPCLISVCDPA